MELMKGFARTVITQFAAGTRLQLWPVRVRAGLARGARWTLYPFSSNWRLGGEQDLEMAFNLLNPKAGAVCWDLGAHFGIYTVGFARQVGNEGQVYAFEPDPVAFARLRRHARMNKLNNVKLFNIAASDRDGELKLIITGGLGSTVTHAKYEDELVSDQAEFLTSKCARLDTLVQSGELRLPNFIKVDVEGHGAEALAGAVSSIKLSRPIIALSIHSPHEWEASRSLLQPLNYTPVIRAKTTGGWETPAALETIVLSA